MHIHDIHAMFDHYLTIAKVMLWSAMKTLTLSLRASQPLSKHTSYVLAMTRGEAQRRLLLFEEGRVLFLNFVLFRVL